MMVLQLYSTRDFPYALFFFAKNNKVMKLGFLLTPPQPLYNHKYPNIWMTGSLPFLYTSCLIVFIQFEDKGNGAVEHYNENVI